MIDLLQDDTELYKQFSERPEFKKWLGETVFALTYDKPLGTPFAG